MLPLCAAEDIGVIAWSPLASGRLTRDWDWRQLVVGLPRLRYFFRFLSFFAFFTGSTRRAGAIISIGGGGAPC
jgi:aryl-alcohol dehydrogenase-like predicted oxidoreductase